MIPTAFVNAWRTSNAPWSTPDQVEQDLVLSRAIVALFSDPVIAAGLALRGGTALHKLYLGRPTRYSNDIDLVQLVPGPIGPLLDAIRIALEPFLGTKARYKAGDKMATLTYGFSAEGLPPVPLKLKVEINAREHGSVRPMVVLPFGVDNPWFTGSIACPTYALDEPMGTKLRALYQRSKGRDLFDLWLVLTTTDVNVASVAECFHRYTDAEGNPITQREFRMNLAAKHASDVFRGDMVPLLAPDVTYDADEAFNLVETRIAPLLRV